MDKLYAKLSEEHSIMQQQQKVRDDEALATRCLDHQSSSSSLPFTPAADAFSSSTAPTARSASAAPGEGQATTEEILRLKLELAQAQNKISRMDQELVHTRSQPESECVTPALVSEHDYSSVMAPSVSPAASRISAGGMALSVPGSIPPFSREHSWMAQDGTPSEIGDPLPTAGLNRPAGIWNNKPAFGAPFPQGQMMMDGAQPMRWSNNRAANYEPTFAPSGMDMYRQDRIVPDQDVMRPMGRRGNRFDNRYGSSNNFGGGGYNGYSMGPTPYEMPPGYSAGPQAMVGGGMGMGMYSPYQQQPTGTALSPHATEFTSLGSSWKGEVSQ
jgi:hypothetical protein